MSVPLSAKHDTNFKFEPAEVAPCGLARPAPPVARTARLYQRKDIGRNLGKMLKAGLRKQITLEQSDAFILQYKALFRSFNAFRDNPEFEFTAGFQNAMYDRSPHAVFIDVAGQCHVQLNVVRLKFR